MSNEECKPIAVVICAAGTSKRFGAKKEYQKINKDKPATVLETVICKFIKFSSVKHVCIAVPSNDKDAVWEMLPEEMNLTPQPAIQLIDGGRTRQESVFNALQALAEYEPGYVLIHDGARPWVSDDIIYRVITAMKKHGAAIPVLPLTDTPKEFDKNFITRHLKRANIGTAQTPQGFKFKEILQAHKKAALVNEEFTDDAAVWGKFCGDVAVVPGEASNKKITFKEDLQ